MLLVKRPWKGCCDFHGLGIGWRGAADRKNRFNTFIFNLFLSRINTVMALLPRLMQATGFSSWSGRFWCKTKHMHKIFEHQQDGIWKTIPSKWTTLFTNMLKIQHRNLVHKKDENENLPLKTGHQKSWWLSADGLAPPPEMMSGHGKVHAHPKRGIPNADRCHYFILFIL